MAVSRSHIFVWCIIVLQLILDCQNLFIQNFFKVQIYLKSCVNLSVFFDLIYICFLENQCINRAPDKLRICVFYAMKTNKNACIIRSECTFTHTYCCVSKLIKFGVYLYAVDDNTSCT
jgi:hypothetical protein